MILEIHFKKGIPMLNIKYLGCKFDIKEVSRIESILKTFYSKVKNVKSLTAVIDKKAHSYEGHYEIDSQNLCDSENADDRTIEGLLYHLLSRANILLDDGDALPTELA